MAKPSFAGEKLGFPPRIDSRVVRERSMETIAFLVFFRPPSRRTSKVTGAPPLDCTRAKAIRQGESVKIAGSRFPARRFPACRTVCCSSDREAAGSRRSATK